VDKNVQKWCISILRIILCCKIGALHLVYQGEIKGRPLKAGYIRGRIGCNRSYGVWKVQYRI